MFFLVCVCVCHRWLKSMWRNPKKASWSLRKFPSSSSSSSRVSGMLCRCQVCFMPTPPDSTCVVPPITLHPFSTYPWSPGGQKEEAQTLRRAFWPPHICRTRGEKRRRGTLSHLGSSGHLILTTGAETLFGFLVDQTNSSSSRRECEVDRVRKSNHPLPPYHLCFVFVK